MNDLWVGVLLGIPAGIVVNKIWELWTRSRSHHAAAKLAGVWIAYNMQGRNVDVTPMPGASPTMISAKSRWSADSHVLEVNGQDISSDGKKRDHLGYLAIDPACPWRGIRTVRYADSDEISEQRIEIGRDGNTLYVFPREDGYSKHAIISIARAA
jgi:hypothetical protein